MFPFAVFKNMVRRAVSKMGKAARVSQSKQERIKIPFEAD